MRGRLPDRACTPGARFKYATRAKVCRPGYARSVRNVSHATKDAVYRAYGIRRHFNGASGAVDHLVSLELGGSNARSNLFPEAGRPRPRLPREGPPRERPARRGVRRADHTPARATAHHARLGRPPTTPASADRVGRQRLRHTDAGPRAAAELPRIGLADAAAILLVIDHAEPERYEGAAIRWLAKLTTGSDVDLAAWPAPPSRSKR